MKTNDEVQPNLNARQLKALAALLDSPSVSAAVTTSGVSRATLDRWLDDATFAAAYRAASRRVFETALNDLQAKTSRAVQTLCEVQEDTNAKPGERVAAARTLLDFALKGREQFELADRIAALEAIAKQGEPSA